MSSIVFVTRNESEAQRLLPFVARGNGGTKSFTVETLPGTKNTFAIVYSPINKITKSEMSRTVAMMSSFLTGFLVAEKANQRSVARERRIREQYRAGGHR